MVIVRPIPQVELERVADAAVRMVGIAKAMATLVSRIDDQQLRNDLNAQISRLLDTAESVSNAVRSSAYVQTSG